LLEELFSTLSLSAPISGFNSNENLIPSGGTAATRTRCSRVSGSKNACKYHGNLLMYRNQV
jgi:hypothetical protein